MLSSLKVSFMFGIRNMSDSIREFSCRKSMQMRGLPISFSDHHNCKRPDQNRRCKDYYRKLAQHLSVYNVAEKRRQPSGKMIDWRVAGQHKMMCFWYLRGLKFLRDSAITSSLENIFNKIALPFSVKWPRSRLSKRRASLSALLVHLSMDVVGRSLRFPMCW